MEPTPNIRYQRKLEEKQQRVNVRAMVLRANVGSQRRCQGLSGGIIRNNRALSMRLIDEDDDDELNEPNTSGPIEVNSDVEELQIAIDVLLAIVEPDVCTSKRSRHRVHIVKNSNEEEEEDEERGEEVGVKPSGDERDEGEEEESGEGENYGVQGADSLRDASAYLETGEEGKYDDDQMLKSCSIKTDSKFTQVKGRVLLDPKKIVEPTRVNDQHLTNILLKINGNLGGLNLMLTTEHDLNIPVISKASTMILGMDVSHGSPGQADVPSNSTVGGWTQGYDRLTYKSVRGVGYKVPLHRPPLALIHVKAVLSGTVMPTLP
ncbi:hypothetical protein GIB67_032169 [Kingdonia uniflora]|uniref:Piwi domain-containing protein n=1 Tax=Kingdonia uniflora TaxID=39325 RepID=A0A7J7MXH0_9MAGN|nr:hypothetical protein GIB67_032169 [Kingdonia uniflora]